VGGTPEVVKKGETGFLSQVTDGSLIPTLSVLVTQPTLRRHLGWTARKWVCEQWSPKRMVEETEGVLLAAASKGA